jgi:hypothetical protein
MMGGVASAGTGPSRGVAASSGGVASKRGVHA